MPSRSAAASPPPAGAPAAAAPASASPAALCPNENAAGAPRPPPALPLPLPLAPNWKSGRVAAPALLASPNKLGAAAGAEEDEDEEEKSERPAADELCIGVGVPNWKPEEATAVLVALGVPNWNNGAEVEAIGAPGAALVELAEPNLKRPATGAFAPAPVPEPKLNIGAAAAAAPVAEVAAAADEEAVGVASENAGAGDEAVVVGAVEPRRPSRLEFRESGGVDMAEMEERGVATVERAGAANGDESDLNTANDAGGVARGMAERSAAPVGATGAGRTGEAEAEAELDVSPEPDEGTLGAGIR